MRINIRYVDERTRAVVHEVWMDPSTGEGEHCSDSSLPPIRQKGDRRSNLKRAETNRYEVIRIARRIKA